MVLLRCRLPTPPCPLHYILIVFCITCRKPNQETWCFSPVAAAVRYWNQPGAGKCFQWCREHSTPCGGQTFLYETIFFFVDTFLVARLAGGHSHPSAPHLLPVRLSLSRGSAWKAFWITVGSPSFPSTSNTTGHFSPYQHVSFKKAKDSFLAFRPPNHNSEVTDSRWTVFSFADLLRIINFPLNKVLGNTSMSLNISHNIITVWKKRLTLKKNPWLDCITFFYL